MRIAADRGGFAAVHLRLYSRFADVIMQIGGHAIKSIADFVLIS